MDASDLRFRLSGGVSNIYPYASLGGDISNTEVSGSLEGLFDEISPEEADDGDVEYRAIFVKNTHVSETAYGAVLYVSSETSSVSTTMAVAYDSTGTQTVANESTAPSSPTLTFSTPTSKATGITLGNIAPNTTKMIWFRRTITAGAAKVIDAGQITVVFGSAT